MGENIFETKRENLEDFSREDIDEYLKNILNFSDKILKDSKLNNKEKKDALEVKAAYLYNMVYKKMKNTPWLAEKRKDVETAMGLLNEEIENLEK